MRGSLMHHLKDTIQPKVHFDSENEQLIIFQVNKKLTPNANKCIKKLFSESMTAVVVFHEGFKETNLTNHCEAWRHIKIAAANTPCKRDKSAIRCSGMKMPWNYMIWSGAFIQLDLLQVTIQRSQRNVRKELPKSPKLSQRNQHQKVLPRRHCHRINHPFCRSFENIFQCSNDYKSIMYLKKKCLNEIDNNTKALQLFIFNQFKK